MFYYINWFFFCKHCISGINFKLTWLLSVFMSFLVDLLILLMDFCVFIQESSLSIAGNQQTFSVKSQVVNIWGFADHVICVTTTQLCHCNMKAAIDNKRMNGCGCVFWKHCLHKQIAGWFLPVGHGLTIPCLRLLGFFPLCNVFVWFWYQSNTGLIKLVGKYSMFSRSFCEIGITSFLIAC